MVIALIILVALAAFIAVLVMIFVGWSWALVIEVYFAIGVIGLLSAVVLYLISPDRGKVSDEITFQISALREMKNGNGNKGESAQHTSPSANTDRRTEAGNE